MSTQPPDTTFRTTLDQALLAAWRRFLDYDFASAIQKVNHTNTRRTIIILGLAASTLAVFSTFVRTPQDANQEIIRELLRVALILIPAIMAGLMTYAVTFAPSLSWLAYRIGAELVRREIYLYRMQAGEYSTLSPVDQQQTLLQRLQDADKRVHKIGAPDPYMQTTIVDVPNAIKGKTNNEKDDGFSTLSIDEYIAYRVNQQKDWYLGKSRTDYRQMRQWRIGVIVATGASAVVAALGFEVWVAVTTAIGVALATYMDLKMFGRNYPIYHPIANLLEIELDGWSILPPDEKTNPTRISNFVKRAEDLFQSERDQWTEQAIQTQQAIEQSLSKSASISRDATGQPPTLATANLTVSQPDPATTVVSMQAPTIAPSDSDTTASTGQPTAPGMKLVYTSTAAQNDQPSSVVITGSTVPPGDSTPAPVVISPAPSTDSAPATTMDAAPATPPDTSTNGTNGSIDSAPVVATTDTTPSPTNGSIDSAPVASVDVSASTNGSTDSAPVTEEEPAKG